MQGKKKLAKCATTNYFSRHSKEYFMKIKYNFSKSSFTRHTSRYYSVKMCNLAS